MLHRYSENGVFEVYYSITSHSDIDNSTDGL